MNIIGYFRFNNKEIPFGRNKSKYNRRSYLVDEKYIDDIKNISKSIGILYEDVYSDSGDSEFKNSYIDKLYLTTNIPNMIEVSFITNLPIDKIRDYKINLLITD